MDQLLLHLDALPRYSAYRPKVIIRTASPTAIPLDAGAQHLDPDDDYLCGLERMLKTVVVDVIERGADVLSAYEAAAERAESTLLVERTALYETEA
jgi:hypothetical protein